VGFEARERIAQAARQNDLRVIVAFGGEFARRDVGTMPEGVAELMQPIERGVFDDGFGEMGHGESGELQKIRRRVEASFPQWFG
jgi:hypothetical protein